MNKKRILLRINDFNTPFWQSDILSAIEIGINRIMVPKAESAENIEEICKFIELIASNDGNSPINRNG